MAKKFKVKFMFNHKRKHPSLVYDEEENKYKFVSITHAKKTKGTLNIPLPENPEVGKIEQAYIRPDPLKDPKKVFSKQNKKFVIGKKNWYWFNKVRKKK